MKHTVVMSQGWPEVFSESLLLPDPGNGFFYLHKKTSAHWGTSASGQLE